jgi:hypothetical protein
LIRPFDRKHGAQPFLFRLLADCTGARVQGGVPGNAVQPARQLITPRDRRRLAREHQECGLKGILGRVPVPENAPADTQNHGPMPLHQGCERRLRGLIAARDEPIQQLGVAELPGRPTMEERIQMPQDFTRRRRAWHKAVPLTLDCVRNILVANRPARPSFFQHRIGVNDWKPKMEKAKMGELLA